MNKKGETLLEVLIALTLITVSVAAAASAMMSATKGLSLSKNYLIAQNLASEGLEIVKNIRDTNWMKFPVDKEDCWLNLKTDITTSDLCDPIKYIDGQNNDYYIAVENNMFTLKPGHQKTMGETTEAAPADIYGLKLEGGEYMTSIDNPSFYRGIRVLPPKEGENNSEAIFIQVIVKWKEGAKPYEITGTEILTNYL